MQCHTQILTTDKYESKIFESHQYSKTNCNAKFENIM